jgi:hypothetical protein
MEEQLLVDETHCAPARKNQPGHDFETTADLPLNCLIFK